MKIPEFPSYQTQVCNSGGRQFSVAMLITLAKDLPVMDIPLDHMSVYTRYSDLTLREVVMHMKTALDSDLSCPIILDEDGDVLDGRHRIMKAILQGEKTIKAVRFDENPEPCRILED